ncbi:urea transporter [Magnetococcales bacterium HHB-1]
MKNLPQVQWDKFFQSFCGLFLKLCGVLFKNRLRPLYDSCIQRSPRPLKYAFRALFLALSEILFLRNAKLGVVVLLVSLLQPNVAGGGLFAVATLHAFVHFAGLKKDGSLYQGFFLYNAILVGMSIGYLFEISFITLFFIAVASILTFLFTLVLNHTFYYRYGLPILSLPFALISSIIYLASLSYSNLFSLSWYHRPLFESLENSLPVFITGFLKSLGTILFFPDVVAGAIFLILFAVASRILLMLSLLGFSTGVLIHTLLTGSFYQAALNPYAFNYILVCIALGGVFFIPSIRSYILSLVGVAISVVLVDATEIFWTAFKVPVFTLPFNLTVLCFLFSLGLLGYRDVAKEIKETPEDTLANYLATLFRFKSDRVAIALPFSGRWSVYQGFHGEWTHQGKWAYACDFVIKDRGGETFRYQGTQLEDYYAFRKPILSPVSGYVVCVVNHLPDNPIGEVDKINNWGNYIILRSLWGVFIEISHFAQHSIKYKKDDYVELGTVLGLCGNSGYSPEPHIHIQVQESGVLGAATKPFCFISYLGAQRVHYYHTPEKAAQVESLFSDRHMDALFGFILDQRFHFKILEDEEAIDQLEIVVKMDRYSGQFFFADQQDNRLYFTKEYGVFYFYDFQGQYNSWLSYLFFSLPRIPLTHKTGVSWKDTLPLTLLRHPGRRMLRQFLSSFHHGWFVLQGEWRFQQRNRIEGTIKLPSQTLRTEVQLDREGIAYFKVGNLSFIRVIERSS